MKRLILAVVCGMSALLFLSAATASDVTINGSAQFQCSLLSKYMKKHGYSYIREVMYKNNLRTNVFAAKDAEVIIKNKYGVVLATERADEKGHFTLSVPEDNNYRIAVKFHEREIENIVSCPDAANFIADMGYFDSEKVGSWLQTHPVSYCYTCGIRYHEMREFVK